MDPFEVSPGIGIGPITLGMTRREAVRAALDASLAVRLARRWPDAPEVLFVADQLQAYFDGDDRVEEAEVAIPRPEDLGEHGKWWRGVRWGTLDLGGSADLVAAAVGAIAPVDREHPEFPSISRYPSIGLCLWIEDLDEWGNRPFESALVMPRPPGASEG